jgi:hypothetical protein
MDSKEKKLVLRPKMNLQVADNELILVGVMKKKMMFGTIKFEG